jgi:plastocyanin
MPTAPHLRGRRDGRVAAIAAATATLTLLAVATPAAAAGDCGADAMTQPVIDHVNSAHLERSPLQQVNDLLQVDKYVLAHTVLAESVLAPIVPTTNAVLDPLQQHVQTAHLERSPFQQAADLLKVDDYVLAHTVLVESLLKPVIEGCADSSQPAPAPMPGHGTMPAPQPAPALGHGAMPAPQPAPAPATPPVAPVAVEIRDYAYAPKTFTVPTGATVTWTNHDADSHTVTGSGLKSKSFGMNGSYSYTFTKSGTFSYACSLHPQMKGTVNVQ